MILIALMSGGDYITEGIPGCGIKVACEAARAGFGRSLCQLSRSDATAFGEWRALLRHELQTNESKYFRVKHNALKIPENFPDKTVLGYYTHPVVSISEEIEKLKIKVCWDAKVDIQGLRLFVAEAFGWTHKSGAHKFMRVLASALLVDKFRRCGESARSREEASVIEAEGKQLVQAVTGKRTHFSTDGMSEVRVSYIPANVVDLDLDAEEDDKQEHVLWEEEYSSSIPGSPLKKRGRVIYDATRQEKIWTLEVYAKIGIPLMIEEYEKSIKSTKEKKSTKPTNVVAKRNTTRGHMRNGALDKFIRVTKPRAGEPSLVPATEPCPKAEDEGRPSIPKQDVPSSPPLPPLSVTICHQKVKVTAPTSSKAKKDRSRKAPPPEEQLSLTLQDVNPWTLSKRSHKTPSSDLSRGKGDGSDNILQKGECQ
jgi:Holliday junction resolvase YEN1